MLDPARSYDLIGDVHGCALTLEHLLDRLGYHKQGGVWRHPSRMAVFVGDIIDRGPRIREALHIVHDMVVAGQALCIMGNHEFNASSERLANKSQSMYSLTEQIKTRTRYKSPTIMYS